MHKPLESNLNYQQNSSTNTPQWIPFRVQVSRCVLSFPEFIQYQKQTQSCACMNKMLKWYVIGLYILWNILARALGKLILRQSADPSKERQNTQLSPEKFLNFSVSATQLSQTSPTHESLARTLRTYRLPTASHCQQIFT